MKQWMPFILSAFRRTFCFHTKHRRMKADSFDLFFLFLRHAIFAINAKDFNYEKGFLVVVTSCDVMRKFSWSFFATKDENFLGQLFYKI